MAGYGLTMGYLWAGLWASYVQSISYIWAGYGLAMDWLSASYGLAISYLLAGYRLAMGQNQYT